MKLEDYKNKVRSLKSQHKKELNKLAVRYAYLNSTVKIGDIVTDHIGSIRVQEIKVSPCGFFNEDPSCVYCGVLYTKAGKPFKSGERRSVYQTHLKSVNGVKIKDKVAE